MPWTKVERYRESQPLAAESTPILFADERGAGEGLLGGVSNPLSILKLGFMLEIEILPFWRRKIRSFDYIPKHWK